VYLAFAQLGVAFPAADTKADWAWAGAGDEVRRGAGGRWGLAPASLPLQQP
jgi:hypothetical protein